MQLLVIFSSLLVIERGSVWIAWEGRAIKFSSHSAHNGILRKEIYIF